MVKIRELYVVEYPRTLDDLDPLVSIYFFGNVVVGSSSPWKLVAIFLTNCTLPPYPLNLFQSPLNYKV
jgi:hypothetical protein